MYGQQSEELPHHLALSITRILDLKTSPDTDPLDAVGDEFNVIDVVNGYFPDGAFALEERQPNYQWPHVVYLEESLGRLDAVQVQLEQDEQDLLDEIAQLQDELRGQQEDGKVQLIQGMIFVRPGAHINFAYL
jgi:hypothetical protein